MNRITELQVMGQRYRVDWVNAVSVDGFDAKAGSHDAAKGVIRISTLDMDGEPRCEDYINQTFWHEVIEAIKYHLQMDFRHEDIDGFASCLLQVLKQITGVNK